MNKAPKTINSICGYDCEAFTFANILADKAAKLGDKPFLIYLEDGRRFSYAEIDELSNRLANGLLSRGIGKGSHVSMLMQNSPEQVLTYFALGKIGAVVIPINTAVRGAFLAYYLKNSDSVALIVDQEFLDSFLSVETEGLLATAIVYSSAGSAALPESTPTSAYCDFRDLQKSDGEPPGIDVNFSDTAALMYTSGTTGPSKGNIFSQIHALNFATPLIGALDYNSDDIYHIPLPLFHVASFNHALLVMLIVGGSVALSKRLSVSRFWDEVNSSKATRSMMMSIGGFLLQEPPSPKERLHCLRTATAVPMMADAQKFEDRFGVSLTQAYGLTDCCLPLSQSLGDPPSKRFSIGRVMPGCEVRLVDEFDRNVEVGSIGEIVIRKDDMPFAVAGGYYKMPEATLAAIRNLWFHTGDRGRQDEDGYFYFVDRKKDAIRRHGENISTFEVEALIAGHTAVADVAAFPVKSDAGEDDVGISIVIQPMRTLTEVELFEYCRVHMPRYMVPRYIDIRAELPRTATQKVRKQELRDHMESHTESVWDCERFNLVARRGSKTFTSKTAQPSQSITPDEETPV
jgi:crotonobetaine/carnitine-CoA ligase